MDIELKKHIEKLLNQNLGSKSTFLWQPVTGGSINLAYKISTNQNSFFVKINDTSVFKNGFREEVLGLQFLSIHFAEVPNIIDEGCFKNHIYLILKWIETGVETNQFWENFGGQLANLHLQKGNNFGLDHSNFMGQLPQNNESYSAFSKFFVENRLKPQVKLAFDSKRLSEKNILQFENLYKKIPSIIPKEKPSAIHGDLWSGNFICGVNEQAVFIDPAVYYGHREVDLAMTTLFGGFSTLFFNYYEESYPLESGFQNRKEIYNLYPLLIHLNLFGNSYFRSIESIISKF